MTHNNENATEKEQLAQIDKLLEEASDKPLSREERKAQMVSFALGMMGETSTLTREEVEKLAEEYY